MNQARRRLGGAVVDVVVRVELGEIHQTQLAAALEAFEQRLEDYVSWHQECKSALASGSTISDALILEFEEAAAWIALDPPNVLEMFAGELGDPLSS